MPSASPATPLQGPHRAPGTSRADAAPGAIPAGGAAVGISGVEDEYRLAAGKPVLLYLKRPAAELEPRLAAMIDGIRAAGTVSYWTFATPGELERLLADDLAVLLSERFTGAAGRGGPLASPAGPGEPEEVFGDVPYEL